MRTIALDIDGMHCGGCASRVQSALSEVEGVEEVEVSLDDGEARVATGNGASAEALLQAVERAGYTATLKD